MNYLPGLASNCYPPDLCLLSSQDYRNVSLAPSRCISCRQQTTGSWVGGVALKKLISQSASFNWKMKTIYIQGYYRKVCTNSCHFLFF
jgi:hypothetical protein